MKIQLERAGFFNALQIGGSCAIKSKILLPINECIKLEIKDKTLRIYSTDGENSISKKYGNIDSPDAEFCIPANQLIKYISSLNCDVVTIESVLEENKVVISHNNGNLTLPLYDTKDFPTIPSASTKGGFFKIDSKILTRWVILGEPFIVKDELKPQRESLFVEAKNGKMSFCCTEQTMAVSETIDCEENISAKFMISKNSFTQLLKMLNGTEEVLVWNKENHVMFAGGGVLLSIRKKEGNYFNYGMLFTGEKAIHCKVNKSLLSNAIKRVNVSSEIISRLIIVSILNNKIELMADDKEGSKSSEYVECECDGEIKIGFNYDRLITGINATEGDFINIGFDDFKSNTIITSCSEAIHTKVAVLPFVINDL